MISIYNLTCEAAWNPSIHMLVVWPEENWPPTEPGFSFFVLSLMEFGFLPLSPLACLVGDTYS